MNADVNVTQSRLLALPPELRLMIWHEHVENHYPGYIGVWFSNPELGSSSRFQAMVQILRVNRMLSGEVASVIYGLLEFTDCARRWSGLNNMRIAHPRLKGLIFIAPNPEGMALMRSLDVALSSGRLPSRRCGFTAPDGKMVEDVKVVKQAQWDAVGPDYSINGYQGVVYEVSSESQGWSMTVRYTGSCRKGDARPYLTITGHFAYFQKLWEGLPTEVVSTTELKQIVDKRKAKFPLPKRAR